MGGKGSGRRPALKKEGVPIIGGLDKSGTSFCDLMMESGKICREDAVILNMAAFTFQQWIGMAQIIKEHGTMTKNRFGEKIAAPWALRERQLFRDLIAALRELKATPATRAQALKMAEETVIKPQSLIDTDIGEEL